MTPASLQALDNLRDPSHLQWYVIPLLALTVVIYSSEVERRNWNVIFAGLAFWGMDWLNEIANGIILQVSNHSALWTTPGKSAYIIFVGLNVEICFMFSIAGIGMAKLLPKDKHQKILGIPNRLFIAVTNSIFCVFVEVWLNKADMLIWEYSFWNFPHVWLIIIFGYLHFHLVAFWVHDMERVRSKVIAVSVIYGIAAVAIAIFGIGLGWL